MFPRLGIAEVLISCVVGLFSLGIPATILILLFMIYNKLKVIESLLNKTAE
jgi:hypothetical protein